ncbi:MAG: Allantoicase [Cirrosporium novae-zelandiae]|nr:MAG: Allantoicase [Cirrosporium novae-zelandiae]
MSTTAPTPVDPTMISTTFAHTTNLSSSTLLTHILSLSDDWFASATNLLTPTPPIHRPGVFVSTGAWYDGWETRRHNPQPYDFVVLRLGVSSGHIQGIEIDTAFFKGNEAPAVSVEGCYRPQEAEDWERDIREGKKEPIRGAGMDFPEWNWAKLLPVSPCGPSARHVWALPPSVSTTPFTHIRLRMYPDGGIARLRLYGTAIPLPLPSSTTPSLPPLEELSAALNGGLAHSWSDQHFGVAEFLLMPGRGKDMGDGWETKRSRGKGHVDWVVVRLGLPGTVEKIVLDTKDFKGNFPRAWVVEGWVGDGEPREGEGWVVILKEREAGPHREHVYEGGELEGVKGTVFEFVRLTIVPDGGVKRFRVFGRRRV